MATMPDVLWMLLGAALGFGAGAGVGLLALRGKVARLEAERQAAFDRLAEQQDGIEALETRFSMQFENLANRIFDEKSEKFKKESQEGLGHLLTPLRERLQEFQKKVDDSFGHHAREQHTLKDQIQNIVAASAQMNLQTESLTKALKGDNKAQGNWGEVILEKVLEDSGLRKGVNYITQGADLGLKDAESGKRQMPDVIVLLPEDKHVIIDAKVSLTHYERYCAATDETERAAALKLYLNSVRAHITGLEQRRYQDTEKLGTPDFVLMFMPIEGAYSLAIQQDPALHSYAWDKKIVVVCPSTLFATLRTVASVWRLETQNRNLDKIAAQGGALYDKIAGFVEDMEDIGKKIGATQKSYDEAFKKLSTGTGNILKRTEDLRTLGVKTSKKISKNLVGDELPADNIENIEDKRAVK